MTPAGADLLKFILSSDKLSPWVRHQEAALALVSLEPPEAVEDGLGAVVVSNVEVDGAGGEAGKEDAVDLLLYLRAAADHRISYPKWPKQI